MTPTPLPGSKPDAVALAEDCRFDLKRLSRMPHDQEYITPHETLLIVHLGRVYGVDWTVGLEPTGAPGERVRRVRIVDGQGQRAKARIVSVRVRTEPLLQDLAGTDVPDGDILWAMDVLGALRAAVRDALRLNLMAGA